MAEWRVYCSVGLSEAHWAVKKADLMVDEMVEMSVGKKVVKLVHLLAEYLVVTRAVQMAGLMVEVMVEMMVSKTVVYLVT